MNSRDTDSGVAMCSAQISDIGIVGKDQVLEACFAEGDITPFSLSSSNCSVIRFEIEQISVNIFCVLKTPLSH